MTNFRFHHAFVEDQDFLSMLIIIFTIIVLKKDAIVFLSTLLNTLFFKGINQRTLIYKKKKLFQKTLSIFWSHGIYSKQLEMFNEFYFQKKKIKKSSLSYNVMKKKSVIETKIELCVSLFSFYTFFFLEKKFLSYFKPHLRIWKIIICYCCFDLNLIHLSFPTR